MLSGSAALTDNLHLPQQPEEFLNTDPFKNLYRGHVERVAQGGSHGHGPVGSAVRVQREVLTPRRCVAPEGVRYLGKGSVPLVEGERVEKGFERGTSSPGG